MDHETVIQFAREADVIDFRDDASDPHVQQMVEFLKRFAAAVEQRTLERAAQEAEAWQTAIHDPRYECDCAAAIRALKDGI